MASVDLHELSGAFALDALEGDERELFEAHLSECAACRREVERFHVAAAWLASTLATRPPSHLADAVMATVAGRRQTRVDDRLPPDVVGAAGGRVVPLPEVGGPGRGRAAARRAGLRRRVLVPAAAAVAAAALTVLSVRLVQTDHRLSHYRDIAEVAAAPGGQAVELAGPAGKARVLLDRGRNRAVVLSDSLAAVSDQQTYELWQLGSGDPRPAGVFRPGSDAKVQHVFDVDVRSDTNGLGVTVEPRHGSLKPTSQIVLSGKLGG